jgi:hypothetical protein
MRKLVVLCLFIITVFLTGCTYEYEGKDVESITYTTVDYMGGYTHETIVQLEEGIVYHREYFMNDEELPIFDEIFYFDPEKVNEFLDQAGKAGLFDLKDRYESPEGVLDGGSWKIDIRFIDDEVKESIGINNFPDALKEIDYAFFALYGDDLFNSVPSSYKNPPYIDFSIRYSTNNVTTSNGSSLSPMTYTWHGKEITLDDPFTVANNTLEHQFDSNRDYTLVLWTANYPYKFSKMVIKVYNIDGTNEEEIANTRFFKQKEYDLEINKVYVITMTYDYGTVDYYLSTKITE